MPWTQISRDPYARTTLLRRIVRGLGLKCGWCGGTLHLGRLFEYAVQADDSTRINPIKGRFCSVSCMRTYHK